MRLVIATRSEHKLGEIRRILAVAPGLTVLSLDEAGVERTPEEDGLEPYDTFVENATSKARYYAARTGLPTVADDSGLCVDALGGRPGVRSKRFARDSGLMGLTGQARDDANNQHLVNMLSGIPAEERTAQYRCVAVLVDGDRTHVFEGSAAGIVAEEPSGDGGFGYDPCMLVPGTMTTYADLTPEEKDAKSHRGAAFRALADHLNGDQGARSTEQR